MLLFFIVGVKEGRSAPGTILESVPKTVIRKRLKANTRKNLSLARVEAKGIALLEAAKESYPAISKEDVRCEQVCEYAKRIADLKEKKEQFLGFSFMSSKEPKVRIAK